MCDLWDFLVGFVGFSCGILSLGISGVGFSDLLIPQVLFQFHGIFLLTGIPRDFSFGNNPTSVPYTIPWDFQPNPMGFSDILNFLFQF